jgi:hypothetical protein
MTFAKFFKDEKTITILSFVIGLGLAIMLFHRPIPTIQTLSLPVSKIEGSVVRQGEKCYQYHAEDAPCEILPTR